MTYANNTAQISPTNQRRHRTPLLLFLPSALLISIACGSTESDPAATGGTAGSGGSGGSPPTGGSGATTTGGSTTGGQGGTTGGQGGTTAGGTGTGATGGTGGISGTGGEGAVAGVPSGGSGGEPPTGGAAGIAGQAGSGPTGEVGVLGDPCSPPAALACAGNFQKVTLICGASGTWEVNETCPGTQICDTRPGLTQGTCQDQHPDCIDHEPGYRFCVDNNVHECGPDNLDQPEVEQCTGACEDGVCYNECPASSQLIANCVDDCGGVLACWESPPGCPRAAIEVHGSVGRVFFVRMPPSEPRFCWCDSGRASFQIRELAPDRALRITVPEPWGVYDWSIREDEEACTVGHAGPTCLVSSQPIGMIERVIVLATDEESLEPQNITIEVVGADATCP
jgi:hypothetical protein